MILLAFPGPVSPPCSTPYSRYAFFTKPLVNSYATSGASPSASGARRPIRPRRRSQRAAPHPYYEQVTMSSMASHLPRVLTSPRPPKAPTRVHHRPSGVSTSGRTLIAQIQACVKARQQAIWLDHPCFAETISRWQHAESCAFSQRRQAWSRERGRNRHAGVAPTCLFFDLTQTASNAISEQEEAKW